MNTNEKKLLRIAVIIFAVYILPFELLPFLIEQGRDYQQDIAGLKNEIKRHTQLGKDAVHWQNLHQQTIEKRDTVNNSLLEGSTQDIIGARMQAIIKGIAQNAGITFRSMDIAEFSPTGNWLLVTQSMQFEATSATLIKFLQDLGNAKEDLAVVMLDIRGGRGDMVNGTVKVTAFSQLPNRT